MTLFRSRGAIVAAAFLLALVVLPGVAMAHERRDVGGGYQFVVGWLGEPAYEGIKNGLDLRVSKDGKPVLGVEKTLKLDITHVDSNTTKSFAIKAISANNDPGHYTTDVLPTVSGVYKFRFTGQVDSTNIDQTFTSGPGTFGSIEPTTPVQFPQPLASVREVQGAAKGASDAAAAATAAAKAATDAAASARTLAIAGVALGTIGMALGGMSLRKR